MLISENTKVTVNLILLVTLIFGLIGGAVRVGQVINDFEMRLEQVEESYIEHATLHEMIDENSARLALQDIKFAEIQTDLKWIRMKLEEF